jgi:peroxiredoxin
MKPLIIFKGLQWRSLLIGDYTMQSKACTLAISLSVLFNICPEKGICATSDSNVKANNSQAKQIALGTEAAKSDEKIDEKTTQILKKMSAFYAGLQNFRTVILYNLSVRQGSAKESRDHTFKIMAQKPNKISISLSGIPQDRFDGSEAKMDGQRRFLYNPRVGYISGKATPTFNDSFKDREFGYATGFNFAGMNLLEILIADNPLDALTRLYGVNGGKFIGTEEIDGVACDHIQISSAKLGWDIWVENGSKPWVRRVSPVLGKVVGDQSLSLTFNYNDVSDAPVEAKEFSFTPPAAAKEITTFFDRSDAAHNVKASQEPEDHELLKTKAPDLKLSTLGGGTFDLASHLNKNIVVLDFWATWCPPCREALPILAEVTKSFESRGVKFVAIDLKEEPGKVENFIKSHNLDITVAFDKDGAAASAYKARGIPQSVIIGKDGLVKAVHVGFSSNLKDRLTDELEALLKE